MVLLPRCSNPDVVEEHGLLCLSLKAKLESLPWPTRCMISNAGASSATPCKDTGVPEQVEVKGNNGALKDDQVLPVTVTA